MNYTEKDIIKGCSFKRNCAENSRLICEKIDGNLIHWYDSVDFGTYQYTISAILNHINCKQGVDFQKNAEYYEIY